MASTDDHTMNLGLLMETAHQHQLLAESSLEKLGVQLREIDGSVREEVRRVMQSELLTLTSESRRTREALAAVRHSIRLRITLWTLVVTGSCAAVAIGAAVWILPSRSEIDALRARRDSLISAITQLERSGALLDLRPCGTASQLCVRVDRTRPTYGVDGDYFVIKGR